MSIENKHQKSGLPIILRWGAAIGLLLGLILLSWLLFEDQTARFSATVLTGDKITVALGGAGLLALDAVLPVPSSLVATGTGALLGGPAGTLVNAAGLTLCCLLGYVAGIAGRPVTRRLLGIQAESFERWMASYGVLALIICRPVPVLAEASVFALGAGRARPGPLLVAALLVDVPLGALYAFAGAASGSGAMPGAFAICVATFVPAAAAVTAWLLLRGFERRRARPFD